MPDIPPSDRLRLVLRGNYPNTWTRFFARDPAGRGTGTRPGYLPPEVEHHTEPDGPRGTLTVREADVPLLNHPDPAVGNRHLEQILRARAGDPTACAAVDLAVQPHLDSYASFCRDLRLIHSNFVVPSYTPDAYDDLRVSHKGANLLRFSQRGYPVPDFAILSARCYPRPAAERVLHLADAVEDVEHMTSRRLGSRERPLVVAMRFAMPEYLPGLMPTYLNVGVTEVTFPALVRIYGHEAASKMFLNNLKNLAGLLEPDVLALPSDDLTHVRTQPEREEAIGRLLDLIRKTEPALAADAREQAAFLLNHAYRFFEENRDLILTVAKGQDYRPSLILQQMICTVRAEVSYPGVLYTRNPHTGRRRVVESVPGVFGEEFMTGTAHPEVDEFAARQEVRARLPEVYHFAPAIPLLERDHAASVTAEFAAEVVRRGRFFAMLQLDESEMTGRATLIAAMDLHREGMIPGGRVAELVRPYHLRQLGSPKIDASSMGELKPFCRGFSILPRTAASARIYFSAGAALAAKRRGGERVCICRQRFAPTDTVVMGEMDMILGLTPGAIHVVTACRGFGIPAFLDLESEGVRLEDRVLVNSQGATIEEGEWITVSCKQGVIYKGRARLRPARLQQYLDGKPLDVEPDAKEMREFVVTKEAYDEYRQLVAGLDVAHIAGIDELIKHIRFDLSEGENAAGVINDWFDALGDAFVRDVLGSQLGSHLERFRVYERLTVDRRAALHRQAVATCRLDRRSGFSAGSFMLGRFISIRHTTGFWNLLAPEDVAFLLEEWVLFLKYLQVLDDVGERRISRARDVILGDKLGTVSITPGEARVFASLKLSDHDLAGVEAALDPRRSDETAELLGLLRQPWSALYDFDQPRSLAALGALADEAGIPVPAAEDV